MTSGSFAKALVHIAAKSNEHALKALADPFKPVSTEAGLAVIRSLRLNIDLLESVVRETAPPQDPHSAPSKEAV